jgi:hypothetical protein
LWGQGKGGMHHQYALRIATPSPHSYALCVSALLFFLIFI